MRDGTDHGVLRRRSGHRALPLAWGLFAIVLTLPTLGSGLFQDDVVHRAKLLEEAGIEPRYYGTPLLPLDSGTAAGAMRDMFAVARSAGDVKTLMDLGLFPWWTSEHLRVSNWRPLTALTHWADYQLFGDTPAPMHMHNVLWFGGVAALVACFYRRMMPGVWVASLAALLYVIDESNYFPVRWLANRNLLMALCFSVSVLLCHDRWRQSGSKSGAVAAPVLLALSLLSTEAAVATFAYLFAYAVVIDKGRPVRRILSLVPAAAVIVGWRLIYNALGHGASGGGFVNDPGREPLAFALAVLKRAPLLLSGQWTPLPADMGWLFSERAQTILLAGSYAFLIVLFVVFLPLLRTDRVSFFWFLGMVLCVLPICATAPMNRNLLFAAIGAFGLTARYVGGVLGREGWVPKWRPYRVVVWIVCVTLLLMHIPAALVGRVTSPRTMALAEKVIYSTVDIGDQPDLPGQTVFVVNAPNPFLFIGWPQLRSYEGKPMPKLTRVLVPGWRSLEISRTGQRTLVVRSTQGSLFSVDESRRALQPNFVYLYDMFNTLFRNERDAFQVGDRTELAEMSVEVLSVDAHGFPNAVQFDFAGPLEEASHRWLQWTWRANGAGAYGDFTVPAVGQTVTLPGLR